MSICHTEGKVSIRIECLRNALSAAIYHLSAHVVPVGKLEVLIQLFGNRKYVVAIPLGKFIIEVVCRVVEDGLMVSLCCFCRIGEQ